VEPRRNIELKCHCADLAAASQALTRLGAHFAGVETQTDTYFHVPSGRLKLRRIEGSTAVLIAYTRPDQPQYRTSSYHLAPVHEPEPLLGALAAALGVRAAVRKRRQIFLWHNVRIHLDEVDGLGTFVEFEAVLAGPQDEIPSRKHLDELAQVLTLDPSAGLATSYADLGS
jgi:predicted adenylyl cyclase CyaB